MKLNTDIPYLKKIQKICKSHNTPSVFFTRINNLCYISKTDKSCIFTFMELLKVVWVKMIENLVMKTKLTAPDLVKPFHDVTIKF